MRKRFVLFCAVLSLVVSLFLFAAPLQADVPDRLNYQGTLTDGNGNPLTGAFDITLSIYDQPANGLLMWGPETHSNVQVRNGLFSVTLGETIPLNGTHFVTAERYIGIQIGSDPEMSPRQRINSVPYAINAGNVADGVPSGVIVMWSGQINDIPSGWALCDGQNGTPDLRDRFIAGAGGGYPVGQIGGTTTLNTTHSHTISSQSPSTSINGSHAHSVDVNVYNPIGDWWDRVQEYEAGGSGSPEDVASENHGHHLVFTTGSDGSHSHTVNSHAHGGSTSSDGASLENRPPYYALAFIIKL